MSSKIQCNIIQKSFFLVIEENAFSAVLMLGNLYRLQKQAKEKNDKRLIETTLSDVKRRLTVHHVRNLWQAVVAIPTERWHIMDRDTRKSINTVQHKMICDSNFFLHIDTESLVKLGQNIKFNREILITLVRKHLAEHGLADPFSDPDFSYELLRKGGAEQNSAYLCNYFKRCPSLPIESIFMLGKHKSDIASFILMDLKDSQCIFEIGSHFAKEHPTLRATIANDWQSHIQIYPLTTQQNEFVSAQLDYLKAQFVEFSEVRLDTRLRRNLIVPDPTNRWGLLFSRVASLIKSVIEKADEAVQDTVSLFDDASLKIKNTSSNYMGTLLSLPNDNTCTAKTPRAC